MERKSQRDGPEEVSKGRRSRRLAHRDTHDQYNALYANGQKQPPAVGHKKQISDFVHPPPVDGEKAAKSEEMGGAARHGSFQKTRLQPQAPEPTEEYLVQAMDEPPRRLPSCQPLLIILDLNGTLGYRSKSNLYHFRQRPGLQPFLRSVLDNYKVMIWSSARPHTVNTICSSIFTQGQRETLVAEWARDKFGLTPAQYVEHVQVYKLLDAVWNDVGIQSWYPKHNGNGKTRWDQSNTILIDDTQLKAVGQPFNILQVPEFGGGDEQRDVFYELTMKLDILARFDDVSKVMRAWKKHPSDDDDDDEDALPSVPIYQKAWERGPVNHVRS